MAVQDLVRWLLPKEEGFFEVIHQQAETLVKTTAALAEFEAGVPASDVAKRVQALEHEGDRLLKIVEDQLAKTFVTPIDREDIQSIAARMDDVIDKVNLTARSISLFGITEPSEPMTRLFSLLVAASSELVKATAALRRTAFGELGDIAKRVKVIEKEGDSVFRDAVAFLFRDPAIDAKELLRQKEILEDLEEAIDLCEDSAEFFVTVAVKHR